MTYIARTTKTADEVKKGDLVVKNGVETEVASVKVGAKWTEARAENGNLIMRLLNDDKLTVGREELTDEEQAVLEANKALVRRREFNTKLEAWVTETVDGYAAKLAEATEKLIKWGGNNSGSYDTMLAAGAYLKIALQLQHVRTLDQHADKDWTDLYNMWVEYETKQIVGDRYNVRVLSRSTSVMSNLVEDIDRAAKISFMNAYEFGHFYLASII